MRNRAKIDFSCCHNTDDGDLVVFNIVAWRREAVDLPAARFIRLIRRIGPILIKRNPIKSPLALTLAGRARITGTVKLWRSGVIWSILSLGVGVGNMLCSSLLKRYLVGTGDFGEANTAADYATLLGLPLQMLTTSVIHYIAHFRSKSDDARLQGLLAGCQKLLFWATIGGSVLALGLWQPLGLFFGFKNQRLMQVIMGLFLVGCWSGLAVALCQGMAWFKRLAVINGLGVCFRIAFIILVTQKYPSAASGLISNLAALLATFILFYWWKDIFRHPAKPISPWTPEFVRFLIVTGATVAGTCFFGTGDSLVSKKDFSGAAMDNYQMASKFARAIPMTVLPLLWVTFTSRSGSKEGSARSDQRILLALYAGGLAACACGIIVMRNQLVRWFGNAENHVAADMLIPFSLSMVLIGLNQAVGMWSLADRTFKIALLYGAAGLTYWICLLNFGTTPDALLKVMPIGAGISFVILCVTWFADRSRRGKLQQPPSAESAP